MKRTAAIMTIGVGLLLAPNPAGAQEANLEESTRKVFDLVLLRPLGLIQTTVSAAFLVAALPVAAATGSSGELVEICWSQPFDQTFRRPLGEL